MRSLLCPMGILQASSRCAHTRAAAAITEKIGSKSQVIFDRESKFGAHNYGPIPVAICKGKGTVSTNLAYC